MDDQRIFNSVAPLKNVAALTELIDRVQHRAIGLPGMACFYGWSGFGKSTAAIYAANRFQAVLVQVKSNWTKKNLVKAILVELGVTDHRGNTADMADRVAGMLAMRDAPLIIDEADFLVSRGIIETVRDIYEGSQSPVILIGEEGLPQKLKAWERLDGRMRDWVAAQPADMTDLDCLAGIYAQGVEIDRTLKSELLKVSHGSIRRICVNLAQMAERAAVLGVDQITREEFAVSDFFTGEAPTARRTYGGRA